MSKASKRKRMKSDAKDRRDARKKELIADLAEDIKQFAPWEPGPPD